MSYPTDINLQINQLPASIELPEKYEEAHEILSLILKQITDAVNKKEGSLYSPVEFGNFQSYFTPGDSTTYRNAYRKTFDLVFLNAGNIGAGATVVFPHGIVGLYQSAGIIAYCTSVTPTYFSVTGQPAIYLDNTNIYFTNPLGVALTAVYVVAEYLKN